MQSTLSVHRTSTQQDTRLRPGGVVLPGVQLFLPRCHPYGMGVDTVKNYKFSDILKRRCNLRLASPELQRGKAVDYDEVGSEIGSSMVLINDHEVVEPINNPW